MSSVLFLSFVLFAQASGATPTQNAKFYPPLYPTVTVRPAGVIVWSSYVVERRPMLSVSKLKERLRTLPQEAWRDGRALRIEEMAFLPGDEPRLQANVQATLAVARDLGISTFRFPRAQATASTAERIEHEDTTMGELGATAPTRASRLHQADEVLALTEQAIAANPTAQWALVARVRMLQMKTQWVQNAHERAALLAEANRLWRHAVEIRLAPKKPASPTSSDLSAAIFGESFTETVARLSAITDTSSECQRVTIYWAMRPAYPTAPGAAPIARIVIGPDGVVMNGQMIKGEPDIARSVLEAARLRFFTPPKVNENAVACVQTLAFPAK